MAKFQNCQFELMISNDCLPFLSSPNLRPACSLCRFLLFPLFTSSSNPSTVLSFHDTSNSHPLGRVNLYIERESFELFFPSFFFFFFYFTRIVKFSRLIWKRFLKDCLLGLGIYCEWNIL